MQNQWKRRGMNPLGYLFGKTWRYSEGRRKSVVCFSIMFVIAKAISRVFLPLIIAAMFNIIQKQGLTTASVKLLLELLLLGVVVYLVFWSLHGPARIIERKNAFKVRAHYRKYLSKGLLMLPIEWQVEHHSGDTIDKIEKGTRALYDFSGGSFQFIYAGVQFVVSYGMLVYISPPSAYIVLVGIVLIIWVITRFDRVILGQYMELNRAENAVSESITDAITNITTVIILRVERFVFEALASKIDKPCDLFSENVRLDEIKWCLMEVLGQFMVFAVMGTYFLRHIGTPKGVVIVASYLLFSYLNQISELSSQFCQKYSEVLQRASLVMNAEELAADFRVENFTNHVLPKDWQELRIEDLSFSYAQEEDGESHLDNLSLSLIHGQKIALVGESGSGKTTLLKIMRDLYHPRSIKLSVDGREIAQGFEGSIGLSRSFRRIRSCSQTPSSGISRLARNMT
jgi:ATP-binding cassette, subfamily B, bacterial